MISHTFLILMNRFALLLIGLFTCLSVFSQEPVLYGERSDNFQSNNTTTRIFLDRHGDFYPDVIIKNEDLKNSNYNLRDYYDQNDSGIAVDQEIYDVTNRKFKYTTFLRLQDSIEQRAIRQLNSKLESDTELYVLIHGFRKPLEHVSTGTNSIEDYNLVKAAILKNRPESNIHFLEVYWDGTYINIKPSIGGMVKLGKLFKKQALPNATRVGLGLRKLISRIDHPRIHIIAHSLGAQVANNVLWNANEESDGLTPAQKIEVCLIAPAIARKPFRKFMNRTGIGYLDSDNYDYSIIYNERDIVVAKSNFGDRRYFRFTRLFGNTKLGCNCSREAIKVKNMFSRRYPNSTVQLYDATEVGNNHRWGAYVQSPAFVDYITSF